MKWVSLQRLSYALSKIEARYALRSHSHAAATTDAAGFMSAADKVKLNGISSGANKYTHPSYTKAVWPVQGHSRYIWACERGGSGCKG